jgi:hypothetical protein
LKWNANVNRVEWKNIQWKKVQHVVAVQVDHIMNAAALIAVK